MLKCNLKAFIFAMLIVAACINAAPAPAGQEDAAQIYLRGLNLFYDAKYEGACLAFQSLIDRFPKRPETRDAIYKIAESHYRKENWEKAGSYYRLYMERFPLAANAVDAKKRLAQCENIYGSPIRAARPLSLYPPLRHVAVISASMPYMDIPDLRRGFSTLAGAGVNTVIIWGTRPAQEPIHRLVQKEPTQQGAYFKTGRAPVIDDKIITQAARVAHGLGMKLLVMLPVRNCPWMLDRQDLMDRKWTLTGNEYHASNLLDPFNSEAMQIVEGLAADLAATSADGIILSGQTSLSEDEGLSPKALEIYNAANGEAARPEKFFHIGNDNTVQFSEPYAQYALFKTQHMNTLVKNLTEKIKAVNPAVRVFCELDPLALRDPAEALSRKSQDAGELLKTGIDGLFVTYNWRRADPYFGTNVVERIEALAQMSKEAASIEADGRKWIFALPTEAESSRRFLPEWEVLRAYNEVGVKNSFGIALFPLSISFPYNRYFNQEFDTNASKAMEHP